MKFGTVAGTLGKDIDTLTKGVTEGFDIDLTDFSDDKYLIGIDQTNYAYPIQSFIDEGASGGTISKKIP